MAEREKGKEFCFSAADILVPWVSEPQRWAVIACDQFTSQPDYWEKVRKITDGFPSAAHMVLPECFLDDRPEERVRSIHEAMDQALKEEAFQSYRDCYIYLERTLQNGLIRPGILGKVDLEQYDYSGEGNAAVRSTEETVKERIPPRKAVRRGAGLELPHVLLLCNDRLHRLIEPLHGQKEKLRKLYDFDLMLGGGHLSGWLVDGKEKEAFESRFADYQKEELKSHPEKNLLLAVGDGNHSLAAAKAYYEELKQSCPESVWRQHPARYALCELNNIHDSCQLFEPIHRLVTECDTDKLLEDLQKVSFNFREMPEGRTESDSGQEKDHGSAIEWICGNRSGLFMLPSSESSLPLTLLQRFLDGWLKENQGKLDYIHGRQSLSNLAGRNGCVGFLLPAVSKDELFPGILAGGVLPRKTFSLGTAEEKRYYFEARRISL